MANLVVRNLDQRIVDALKQRAARHGRSAEAEPRAILEDVLLGVPKKKSFAQALVSMPNVGRDEDFARLKDADEDAYVPTTSPLSPVIRRIFTIPEYAY